MKSKLSKHYNYRGHRYYLSLNVTGQSTVAVCAISGCMPLDYALSSEVDYYNTINKKNIYWKIDFDQKIDFSVLNQVIFDSWDWCCHGSKRNIYWQVQTIEDQVDCSYVVYVDNCEAEHKIYKLKNIVYMAEIVAIDQAIGYINRNFINQVSDISDSKSALESIT